MRSGIHPDVTLAAGRIGLISDTHGLVRPEALTALKNSELIIHAGDIGSPEVLRALENLAPVLAIRGNNDRDGWSRKLPDILSVRINAVGVHLIHNVNDLKTRPAGNGFQVVISGHSHKPMVATREGILFINPGSAGPRRFKLPVAVARLHLGQRKIRSRIIELNI